VLSSAWSTGEVGSIILVTTPGQYNVNINDGCGTFSKSIRIAVVSPADLGADTTFCSASFSEILSTGFNSTTWSTGATGPWITVSTPGTYIADYSNQCGSFTDSIHISAILPQVLGADTAYCDTIFSRTLSTGFASTVWSNGASGSSITVTSPGTYIATYSNPCGSFADTINIGIDLINGFTITDSFSTLNICNGIVDTILLHAQVDSPSVSPVNFVWSNGQTDHQVYSSSAIINAEGNYTVIVERGSCRTSGQSLVDASRCDSTCYYATAVPDAFSPNDDHKNDEFKVIYSCPVYSFSITISDRWGQTLYQSADIDKGWDGTFQGIPQPQGTYMWFVCVKESPQRNAICRSGTLNLFR
jgi:gliding motility-associated-like protein